MAKYRKIPVVIEAVQWTGDNVREIYDFTLNDKNNKSITVTDYPEKALYIETLEGTMKASEGDYIIKGVQGEIYPCKPNIFEQTYEEVKDA